MTNWFIALFAELLSVICVGTAILAVVQRNTFPRRFLVLACATPVWILTRLVPWFWGPFQLSSLFYPVWTWVLMVIGVVMLLFSYWRVPGFIAWLVGIILAVYGLVDHKWAVGITPWFAFVTVLAGALVLVLPYGFLYVGIRINDADLHHNPRLTADQLPYAGGAAMAAFSRVIGWLIAGLFVTAVVIASTSWTSYWWVVLVALVSLVLIVSGTIRVRDGRKGSWWLIAIGIAILLGSILFGSLPGGIGMLFQDGHSSLVTVLVLTAFMLGTLYLAFRHSRARRLLAFGGIIVAFAAVVLLAIGLVTGGSSNKANASTPASTSASPSPSPSVSASPSPSASPSASASATTCPMTTWSMTVGVPPSADKKWLDKGSPAIAAANTDQDAKVAAMDWLNQAREYAGLLSGAARYVLHEDVDQATLIQGSCASDDAVKLYSELTAAIELSSVVPSQVPTNAYNSSTDNGAVVTASAPGITGSDLKAVKVTTADGSVIYIMARCGNAATLGPPKVVPKPSSTPTTRTSPPSTPSTTPVTYGPSPTPSTHTTQPASPPTVIEVTAINDLQVSQTSNNFTVRVNVPGSDSGTLTITSKFGGHISISTITVHGLYQNTTLVYTAPSEVPPDGMDVVTVFIRDNVTGLSATAQTPPFTIKPYNDNR